MEEEANPLSRRTKGRLSLTKNHQVRNRAGGRGRWWEGAVWSCLCAGARLAGTLGAATPRQPPPSYTFPSIPRLFSSSCPQVAHRLPEAAPEGRQSPAFSLHRVRLPPLPCPRSSQATGSCRTQVRSLRETGRNIFPSGELPAGRREVCKGTGGLSPCHKLGLGIPGLRPGVAWAAGGPALAQGDERCPGRLAEELGHRSSSRWDVETRATVMQPLSSASLADGQPGAQTGTTEGDSPQGGSSTYCSSDTSTHQH